MKCQLTIIFKGAASQNIAYAAGFCKTSLEAQPRAVELVLEDALNKKMNSQNCNIFSASVLSMDAEGQYHLTTELDPLVTHELNDLFSIEERDYDFNVSLGLFIQDALVEHYSFENNSKIIVIPNNKLEPQ